MAECENCGRLEEAHCEECGTCWPDHTCAIECETHEAINPDYED